tara:strand:+ start:140 stop:487 length:348 start_codon:yes stop_codon:yes gene_type:complete
MTKFVINTVEIVKRVYVVDAYTEKESLDKHLDQAPDKVEFIGELIYSVETINEYEYNQKWKSQPDYSEGHNYHTFKDPDIGPDQLKDAPPDQRELFELESEIFKDDDSYEIFRDD